MKAILEISFAFHLSMIKFNTVDEYYSTFRALFLDIIIYSHI